MPKTNDVFGKQLLEFQQLPGHDRDSVPLVFHLLVGYFQDKPEHLQSVGLFRVAVDLQLVTELEVHIAMEDYSFIQTIKDPNVVSNYFKILLRNMSDPICPFPLYDRFLSLSSVDKE